MYGDTIAAIATPVGPGGIGIIRISGPNAINILTAIFKKTPSQNSCNINSSTAPQKNKNRRLIYGNIIDKEKGHIIDEALVAYMPAPHSYTKEDVVEIQLHSGAVTLQQVLTLVFQQGARNAEPGEFTKRAFLNGRIDLSQAEAVMDIIAAKTDQSLRIATEQLKGSLSHTLSELISQLDHALAILEADIEFEAEIEAPLDRNQILSAIEQSVLQPLEQLIASYDDGHLIREGVRLVILGRPNVGKSSLLNRLLEQERAIVTEFPGTTRDSIEETLNLFGLPVVLVDTAGWHQTMDPIEKIGISRAKKQIENAELILFVIDAKRGVCDEDRHIFRYIQKKKKILVVNKSDLLPKSAEIKIPDEWKDLRAVAVSAQKNTGMENLKKEIFQRSIKGDMFKETGIVTNSRHVALLRNSKKATIEALEGIRNNLPSELIALDIKEGVNQLRGITGENISNDVLDQIFGRFCIGK